MRNITISHDLTAEEIAIAAKLYCLRSIEGHIAHDILDIIKHQTSTRENLFWTIVDACLAEVN